MRILRPEEGPPAPEPVDIKSTVESCLRLIAPLAKQAGLKVSKSTGKGLPLLAAGERVLKQILLNVLMNAVRHQKTGVQIQVTARKRKDGAVRLTIADDGKGMTKKEIKSVMRAAPVKAPVPPVPGRSGLGLPLVKRLVESAGGTLTIESKRGKGTTVQMLFPATV
jgi:signal transduction histidine kinase